MSGYRSLAASRAAIFYRNDVSESKIFAALRAAFQLSVAILESIPYLPMGVTASGGLKHTLPTPRRLNQFYPTELDTQTLLSFDSYQCAVCVYLCEPECVGVRSCDTRTSRDRSSAL